MTDSVWNVLKSQYCRSIIIPVFLRQRHSNDCQCRAHIRQYRRSTMPAVKVRPSPVLVYHYVSSTGYPVMICPHKPSTDLYWLSLLNQYCKELSPPYCASTAPVFGSTDVVLRLLLKSDWAVPFTGYMIFL